MEWESAYERTWEVIQENKGVLETSAAQTQRRNKLVLDAQADSTIRRGMHRHLILLIDLSKAMLDSTDMKPSRLVAMLQTTELFIEEFFEENPIAQLSVLLCRNGGVEKLTDLRGLKTIFEKIIIPFY